MTEASSELAGAAGAGSSTGAPAEWVNTWNLFADQQGGSVSQTDLKHIMRCLGRRHTEAEFRDLLRTLPEPVPYTAFLVLMRQPYHGPTEDDLLTALRAFDGGGSGRLRLSELITLLSSLGEKMPEGDVRMLLSELKTDAEGTVSIDELASFLSTPVPTTTPEIIELQRRLGQGK